MKKTQKAIWKLRTHILSDIRDFSTELGCCICLRLFNKIRTPIRCTNNHTACLSCYIDNIKTVDKSWGRSPTTKTICFHCRVPLTLTLPFNNNNLDDARLMMSKHAHRLFTHMRKYIRHTEKALIRIKTISRANQIRQKNRIRPLPIQTCNQFVQTIDLRTPPPSPLEIAADEIVTSQLLSNSSSQPMNTDDVEPPPLAPPPLPPQPYALPQDS